MSEKTVKVKSWHKSQGDFVIINESDFDKDVHTLHGEKKLTQKEQKVLDEQVAKDLLDSTKAALAEKGITFDETADQATLQALLDAAV
jgi:hypothetical protein